MPKRAPLHVLFLCTGNSARSIIAEATLNALGGGRFKAFSAGVEPKGRVHPFALEVLARNGYDTRGLRSKSVAEFEGGKPRVDIVITVCDHAAETCPVFPGKPVSAHWGVPDPAAGQGSEEAERRAFRDTMDILRRRIQQLTSLPLASLDGNALRKELAAIGER